ncbi:uncharacterized protein LOC34623400 [Cyclospora cayetanensis]|uniref:Uncharacterized protein LOC34623400 n=1 Tax=Cyclospora cayetanensis TaxID=88456 RepID=A0A6P6S324_9EIME|nr:uncharacterized protein LOC34623400 [Cyclospora cayetanensis]
MLQNIKRNLFGGDSSDALSEAVKEQRRHIARSIRALDRQHQKAEVEERRVFNELKTQAMSGVQQQQATQELHRHFTGCAKLLSLANKAADLQTMQLAVKGFTRESQKLGLLDEMLNEVLEDGTAQLFRANSALFCCQEDEEETEEEIIQEVIECATAELDRQVKSESDPVILREVSLQRHENQVDHHQQQPVRHQKQQPLCNSQKQVLLQKLSGSARATRTPWLTKDEAAIAERLDQRLGSLLR